MSLRYVGSANLLITKLMLNKRRRAQNRASQQAFRDRTKKRIRALEEKLAGLQGQHDALTNSYKSLQLDYSTTKQELEDFRRGKSM
jgi:AP-1-like factor